MLNKRYLIISILLVFSWTHHVSADCEGKLAKLRKSTFPKTSAKNQKIFRDHFYNSYASEECFENTIGFLEKVTADQGTQFYLVSIENVGASTLGMVSARKARGAGYRKQGDQWVEFPASTEKKWGHHVFAIDESQLVYDFDFTHRPGISPLEKYLTEMFLDVPADLREKKLDDYRVVITRAEFALKRENDPLRKKMTLREWMDSLRR
ncbi:MAG: hypothetical protein EBQ92_10160 [Proteobacteria bacterium]|nr:hypothetical protein [Pseudomonadota bacterium]